MRPVLVFAACLLALPLAAQEAVMAIHRVPLSGRSYLADLIQDRDAPMDARQQAMHRLAQLSREPGAQGIARAEFYGPLLRALQMTGENHAILRTSACEALTAFGQEGAPIAGDLGRALSDANEPVEVRSAAARALGYLTGNPASATGPLIAVLDQEIRRGPTATNIPLVRAVIDSLGKLRQPSGRAPLMAVLESRFPADVKSVAQKALLNFNAP